MRCPSCGANANGAFCEYCGAKMPAERVETHSIHAENVVVNNYYYAQQPGRQGGAGAGPATACSPKSRIIALLLCLFLGCFGAHRFYTGRYLMGAVYLITFGIIGFGWLVDIFLALFGRLRDRNGLRVSEWLP